MADMPEASDIEIRLTGPGGPFETTVEEVLGERMQVFRNRKRSLRELLAGSAGFADKEYLVHGERRISYGDHLALVASTAPHLLVTERQDTALAVLDKLTHQHSEAS